MRFRFNLVVSTGMFCASMLLAGCSQPNSKEAENIEPTNIAEASPVKTQIVNASIPVTRPKPRWATMFSQAVGLIGKSKRDVVEAFGPPSSTSSGFLRKRYSYKIDKYSLHIFLTDQGNVSDLELNFFHAGERNWPHARAVWEALETAEYQPATFQTSAFEMYSYWHRVKENGHAAMIGWHADIALYGEMQGGQKIQMTGITKGPLLKGDPVFDVDKDDYVIKKLYPAPAQSWEQIDLKLVTTRVERLQTLQEEVTEYPVPGARQKRQSSLDDEKKVPPTMASDPAFAACKKNLKLLGLVQYYADNDDKINFTNANFTEELKPYFAPGSFYRCPADKQKVNYSFNGKLTGTKPYEIDYSAKLIMFYEGKDEHLDFPHNGYTNIRFANGDVRSFKKDSPALKDLRWNP